ncbi:hypothetical protein POF50_023040 [Streptomyces sp. SL13]|jgi:hypothetical protein|uniref:PH domain-containing protein n=1 Tax=Streptantibioticus silvisoli TaxID=2705255 RepID=A0AA90H2G7_9ACTN|nr:hypothetical protein [Streptantibioticus silvisoli]MDI5964700.1 hypothetical protein [Streptantibioticus silvisoli]MDI5972174.1 hypothetical protein [Streptantibioticus silvisoli]
MNITTSLAASAAKHSVGIADLSGHIAWLVGLLVLIAVVYLLMWRAWRRRAAGQSDLPELPAVPADPGTALAELSGRYHASTTAGDWLDRIAARDLGSRSLVDLTLTGSGVVVRRPAATDFFIPAAALRGARLDNGIAGKVVPEGGLLVITWAHGDRLIDSGFRSEHPAEHGAWVRALTDLTSTMEGVR